MGGIAMAPEKHLALFYQDREHQRRMMMPFFSECLKQDLKVLYITNDETTRWIDGLFSKLTVSLDKHPKDQQIKACRICVAGKGSRSLPTGPYPHRCR